MPGELLEATWKLSNDLPALYPWLFLILQKPNIPLGKEDTLQAHPNKPGFHVVLELSAGVLKKNYLGLSGIDVINEK